MRDNGELFLVSANRSRPGHLQWDDDDYDVRVVAPDGPVIGRIYKMVQSPSGKPWFWALNLFPAVAADSGAAETREVAMAACKERWERYLGLSLLNSAPWAAPGLDDTELTSGQHNDLCAHGNSTVQVHNVGIVHTYASMRNKVAYRSWSIRSVNSVLTMVEDQRGRSHWISWTATRKDIGYAWLLTADHFGR